MLSETEIKSRELIIEELKKLIDKYQKKADKEKSKLKEPKIIYKGEEYRTRSDIMDAYSCDVFSETVCDKLLDKLDNIKDAYTSMTESEMLIYDFNKYLKSIMEELRLDEQEKLHKRHINDRMNALISEGYSYKQATVIVGNEELMRYE